MKEGYIMKSIIINVILGLLLVVSIVGNIVLFNNNKKSDDSIIQLKTEIEELDTAIVNKENEITESENKVSELEKQITDLQSELDTLNEKLIAFNETNLQIDALGVDGTTEEDEYDETRDNIDTESEKSVEERTDEAIEAVLQELRGQFGEEVSGHIEAPIPEGCTPSTGELPPSNFDPSGQAPAGRLE